MKHHLSDHVLFTRGVRTLTVLALLSTLNPQLSAAPLGTAFTYQGRLTDGGNPANGSYDVAFTLFDTNSSGSAIAGPLTNSAVAVSNGLFTTTLDFGAGVFTGNARWLEISVRSGMSPGAYTVLSPRQPLTPTPYALFAADAGLLGGQAPGAFAPASGSSIYVAKAGDTMTGPLQVPLNGLIAGGSQLVLANGRVGVGTVSPAAKLDVNGTVAATGFVGDGSGLSNITATASNAWLLTGNAGSSPGTHFLGTTDNKALELKVNSVRAFRLEPNLTGPPNVIGGDATNAVSSPTVGATISGGGGNQVGWDPYRGTRPANYAAIGGGQSNYVSAPYAAVAGGRNAQADHYGQFAHASGSFEHGLAQGSLFVLRQMTTNAAAAELFLDGSTNRMTLLFNGAWTFDILITAMDNSGKAVGYQIRGVIRNYYGATAFVGTPTTTVLGEDVPAWDAVAQADDTYNALVIKVSGSTNTTWWVGSVRTVEALVPTLM